MGAFLGFLKVVSILVNFLRMIENNIYRNNTEDIRILIIFTHDAGQLLKDIYHLNFSTSLQNSVFVIL